MTTAYTSLLGLALPVTGELSGTWGDTVNNSITSLLDSAVAGTTTLSADTTLTTTTGASNQARQAILLCTGHVANITITAPAQSKIYTVINASATYTVKIRGVGPTTGITIPVSSTATVAWNGSDFVDASGYINGNLKVNGTLSVTGAVTFTAGTASTTTGTGTLVITGGLGVSGRINAANFDGIIGANTAAAGSFTTLSATGNVTLGDASTDTLNVGNGDLIKDASGNLGLGVTPSTTIFSGSKMMQVGFTPNVIQGITSGNFSIAQGAFFNSSANWQSLGTGLKNTLYSQTDGSHQWFNAPVTTGGSSVSFTQAMTLDASGRLLVGLTSSLNANGTIQAGGFSDTRVVIDGSSTQGIYFTKSGADNGTYRVDASGNYNWFVKGAATANMILDTSGNLGLGVTPTGWSGLTAIQVGQAASLFAQSGGNFIGGYVGSNIYYNAGWKYIRNGYATKYSFNETNNGQHQWWIAPNNTSGAGAAATETQAMTLDTSGNLFLGDTSASMGTPRFFATGSRANDGVVNFQNTTNTSDVNHGVINIINSATGATGNDARVMFSFRQVGATTGLDPMASMGAVKEAGDMAAALQFNTRSASGSYSEKARIDSSGNLLVGTTTKSGAWGLFSLRNASNASNKTWGIGPDTNNSLTIYNQSNVGQYMTDGGTSWTATSDETLKENLTPIENAIEKVSSLRAVVGNYISDKNKTKHPFLIAQDVQRVLPEAISEGLDGALGLSYTEVIPLLVAAIKEQQALITQLTARITALEGA